MLFDELLRQVEPKRVILDVRVNNEKGIRFYIKNGFKQISIRIRFF